MPAMSRSWIIIERRIGMVRNKMRPIHPGEILREEYLVPLDISVNALAKALNLLEDTLHASSSLVVQSSNKCRIRAGSCT